jgi:hypothetical protein
MNLARHAAVLWRFRRITAAGLLLGVFLAVFASYSISPSGLKARGVSTYTSQSQLLVTQPGFPEGRPVLPTTQVIDPETGQPIVDPEQPDFADPARFLALADLYTKLIVSDDVLARLPVKVSPTQVVASPLPAVSGAPILPIIQLDTIGPTGAAAKQLNLDLTKALREHIEEGQKENDIPPAKRVVISTLKAPPAGALASGPSKMASILAFLLCIIGTIAVTHLLENLRNRREAALEDVEDWDVEPVASNGTGHHAVSDAELEAAFANGEWGPPSTPSRPSK